MKMDPSTTAPHARHTIFTAAIFLIVTAVLSLVWSHHKLMSQDEFFVLQTDTAATVSQLIHIQRTTPISLDPLTYHLLAHASVRLFGANAFALRLPSFLGYLLMQVGLFVFVRRLAGDRAAIFALAFPALTATLFYSAEARPYGLLLGLYALTLVAWQSAIRFEQAGKSSGSAAEGSATSAQGYRDNKEKMAGAGASRSFDRPHPQCPLLWCSSPHPTLRC